MPALVHSCLLSGRRATSGTGGIYIRQLLPVKRRLCYTTGRGARSDAELRVGSLAGKRASWFHVNTTLEGLKIFFFILKYWKGDIHLQ